MNRISDTFSRAESRGEMVLNNYLVAGYPTFDHSLQAIKEVVKAGADMIELGIPYSDPVADGKVLQSAHEISLERGMTPPMALELAREVRESVDVPLLIMTYYNPILQYGERRFCQDCREAGVDGLLVPDLPLEEAQELRKMALDADLDFVHFLSLNSSCRRIEGTAKVASGFIYLFSVMGVTGERSSLDSRIRIPLERIRKITGTPCCVGFGISSPHQVRLLKDLGVDGIVVGSGVVGRQKEGYESMRCFVSSLKRAC